MAEKVSKVFPSSIIWPAFVCYILVVSYAMTSLITGRISESLVSARMEDEKEKMSELSESRDNFLISLKGTLQSVDADKNGEITYEELKLALQTNPQVLDHLAALDFKLEEEDFMHLFHKISRSSPNGSVSIDTLIHALGNLAGNAKAAALFDVKTDIADFRYSFNKANEENERRLCQLDLKFTQQLNKLDHKFTEMMSIVKSLQK
eukprot:gnl/TRDRNA2_/TRDRNA2_100571_c0_seq1.p1 gnl/TRDRNA2_/TRDRNA2_100571_c0~~gnl/TRDRNA2_/TRDRNA2_100571_c0_seq1.p1  ORF type:complete len:230 (+),score=47.68 gnl/TRDRNA2_/TRDRNA2_100571_c0_seq1:75-692(+)